MEEKSKKMQKKTFFGEVVSDKMNKTVVVKTERTYTHPIFHKVMNASKKYKVHDEREEASIGDIVEFQGCRPLSKEKYMNLIRVVKKA